MTGHIPGTTVLKWRHAGTAGPGRGSNHVGLRAANERLVLSLIRSHGPLSKAQIAELTGLTAQTASVIARSLIEAGLLSAGDPVKGKVGQPFVPLMLNPNGAMFFGLNLEAAEAQLALVDFTGSVVFEERLAFSASDAAAIMRFVTQAVRRARRRFAGDREQRLQGIGVSGDLAWPQQEEIVAALEKALELPIYLASDAAAACSAELIYGLASGIADFLYVFVGQRVSGGLVLNGRVRFARSGSGPNIGRTLVPDGRGGMVALATLGAALIGEGLPDRNALVELGRGISHAAQAAVSVLGCETLIIDGSIPPDALHQITLAVRSSLMDLSGDTGLSPTVREGSRWRKAIALGAACLPLVDRFFPETGAGP